jgi:phage host-nuclease inhibitor protein Gam
MSFSETMNQYEEELKNKIAFYKEHMDRMVRIKEMEEELQKLKDTVDLKFQTRKEERAEGDAKETALTLCISTFPQVYKKYKARQHDSLSVYAQMITKDTLKYYLEYTFQQSQVTCKVQGINGVFDFAGRMKNEEFVVIQ